MNDHIDPKQIAKAKEWAKRMPPGGGWAHKDQSAAAEVITALPDHIIDAEKVRDVINHHRHVMHQGLENDLESLITSPLPTLADLIEQGHDPAQYQWAQAEHRDERCIIIRMNGHVSQLTISLLTATGATIRASTDEVIPLPDLPCLVWPASEPEPAEEIPIPEVHPKVLTTEEDYRNAPEGTVIEDGRLPIYTNGWAWYILGGIEHNHRDLAGTPRRVLRWGMGGAS